MKNIEIPLVSERGFRYRLFEILPGFLSWSILVAPFVISLISPRVAALLIIAFFLIWFVRAIGLNVRVLQGWNNMKQQEKMPWQHMLHELTTLEASDAAKLPKWHARNLAHLAAQPTPVKPKDIVHAIIIATYNESRDILEPTIKAVIDSHYDMKRVVLILAYEERGGPEVEAQAKQLMTDYKEHFMYAEAVKHPDKMPNEVIGKGGNITFAGRRLQEYIAQKGIDPLHVLVTTLDSDNRPHPNYLPALSYVYGLTADPLHVSFQPIPIFTNNIWDAPAPMRVIATGNSFWMIVQALRPHTLRNFSAHAQPLAALIDTDFWSVRTIVEDGHQFWRTYFRYDGQHEVYPIFLPIYQDAVLSSTYIKTLKAQFIQIRRWAWGASDIAYVADKGFFHKNTIPKTDKTFKFLRLLEGHISWATAPFILLFAAFIPAFFNPENYTANQLPLIASRINTIALAGAFITLFLSLKVLPPKPARYKRHRTIWMVLQWVMLPVTGICYNSFAALNSQTRLIFGRYLGKFDVTDKAVKTDDKKVITGLKD